MPECQHQWEMTHIEFGFLVFEKCSQPYNLRTYFSTKSHPVIGEKYREGNCDWTIMENAQSFLFDLKCKKCDQLEDFRKIMGFMHCTGCLPDCEVEIMQKKYESEKKWVIIAFGFLPIEKEHSILSDKLKILENYFNQRRDISRSTIAVLSYELIADFSRCKGDFIHDVGMLSLEPPGEKKIPF
jgi:hypothetical protein